LSAYCLRRLTTLRQVLDPSGFDETDGGVLRNKTYAGAAGEDEEDLGERLIEAARTGASSDLAGLIAAGASAESHDADSGATALHYCAKRGSVADAAAVVTQGAKVDAVDHLGWTPLHVACYTGHVEVVRYLLTRGAKTGLQESEHNRTALHLACSRGNADCVLELLRSGARLLADDAGDSPAHVAVAACNAACLRLLHKARHSSFAFQSAPAAKLSIIDALVSCSVGCGGDPSKEPSEEAAGRASALLHCCVSRTTAARELDAAACLSALLAAGAAPDAADEHGQTALHIAARSGFAVLCETLLEGGASVDAASLVGRRPLSLAAANGHYAACAVLLGAGASAQHALGETGTSFISDSKALQLLRTCAIDSKPAAALRLELLQLALLEGRLDAQGAAYLRERLHTCVDASAVLRSLTAQLWRGALDVEEAQAKAEAACVSLRENERAAAAAAFPLVFAPRGAETWAQVDEMHAAAAAGACDRIASLAGCGVDLNVRLVDGSTPLHSAAVAGSERSVRYLLEGGANWDVRREPAIAALGSVSAQAWLFGRITALMGGDSAVRRGKSPLDCAVDRGTREPLAELSGREADRKARLAAADEAAATARAQHDERASLSATRAAVVRRGPEPR